jgi:transcriptional regulator with XRE-family HTH domain
LKGVEFAAIRHYLGKTQNQIAQALSLSVRAIQNYEEGTRTIPSHAERQLVFLLFLRRTRDEAKTLCWEVKDCPPEWRDKCSAWEYRAGSHCWFINGTYCQGEYQQNWEKKVELCRQCEMFQPIMESAIASRETGLTDPAP